MAVPPRYIQKMALAVSIFQKVLVHSWKLCPNSVTAHNIWSATPLYTLLSPWAKHNNFKKGWFWNSIIDSTYLILLELLISSFQNKLDFLYNSMEIGICSIKTYDNYLIWCFHYYYNLILKYIDEKYISFYFLEISNNVLIFL